MRIKQVLVVAATAVFSAFAVAAPSIPAAINAAASSVEVRPAPMQADEIAGNFQLDDGRKLKLSNVNSRVYMELDGKREELVPVAQNRFVAKRSGTEVTLDQPAADRVRLTITGR
jgi:hypothetical protein